MWTRWPKSNWLLQPGDWQKLILWIICHLVCLLAIFKPLKEDLEGQTATSTQSSGVRLARPYSVMRILWRWIALQKDLLRIHFGPSSVSATRVEWWLTVMGALTKHMSTWRRCSQIIYLKNGRTNHRTKLIRPSASCQWAWVIQLMAEDYLAKILVQAILYLRWWELSWRPQMKYMIQLYRKTVMASGQRVQRMSIQARI